MSVLRDQFERRNGGGTRIGLCRFNGAGGINQLRRTDPQKAAEHVRWMIGTNSESECPQCGHYADNHDVSGCLVAGCRCRLGIAAGTADPAEAER